MRRKRKPHKLRVRETGRLHFEVSSQSRPGVRHVVDLEPQKEVADPRKAFCSCEAYNFNPGVYCKHIAAVVEFLKAHTPNEKAPPKR